MLSIIGKFICGILFRIVGRLKVVGRERVPRRGGVILAANHVSYIDPPVVGVAAPRLIWFMAKSELFSVPVLGPLIRRLRVFPVKRGVADRQALRKAHELLTGGEAIVIFFEGRRSTDGILLPPELGTAMIALRAGVPIIPTALINTDHLLPRGGKLLRCCRVTVIFGEPLTFPQLARQGNDRAALQEMSNAIAAHVAELLRAHGAADRVPEGYPYIDTEGAAHE